LIKVVDALDRCGIPYMVVGSLSSNVYGIERNTHDADLVLQVPPPTDKLIQELGPDFSVESQLGFETVTMTQRQIASHRDPPFKIELFFLSDDPHDMQRFGRRASVIIGGRNIFVATAEDVVITKLRWSKQGRRTKDIDDVRNVLAVQHGKLDMNYIRQWCQQHGTSELLETTLQSIPPLPPQLSDST
ncbi:MAG: hypothetical protein FWD53_12100, partial [Phycisphaerales bacterium]|nr:hypothetical protein [Phycisphaerales bacterium]